MAATPKHIVLVEDDTVDVEIVKRAIAKSNHKIELEIFSTGDSALVGLEQAIDQDRPIDAVILDIKLPGLSGHDVLERIRSNPKLAKLIVFMVSTSMRDEDRKRGYNQQIAGYIFKDSEDHMIESLDMVMNYLASPHSFSKTGEVGL